MHGVQGGITTNTSFNGGGYGWAYYTNMYVSSGGGGTDLRLKTDDLNSRIIVAGGGGGSGYHTDVTSDYTGGDGGGINGTSSTSGAEGATDSGPGQSPVSGGFGFGGNVTTHLDGHDGCGGGGGYYGGAAGLMYTSGGGGGSGFIN